MIRRWIATDKADFKMTKRTFAENSIIVAGFAGIVAPFLVLCLFNHPQNDDYTYALFARQYGFTGANLFWYLNWSGRYLATALLSIYQDGPGLVVISRIVSLAMLLFILVALYFLLDQLFREQLSRRKKIIAVLILFALYIMEMPNVVQGFYWKAGALTYQLGNILFLAICGVLIRLSMAGRPRTVRLTTVLLAFLIFAASGTNEVTMLMILEITFLLSLYGAVFHRKINYACLVAFLASIVSSAIVLLAPGTRMRMQSDPHQDIVFAVGSALTDSILSLFHWLTETPIVPIALFALPLLVKRLAGKKLFPATKYQFLVPILSLVMYISLFFPSFYATGIIEERTENVIYLFFLIACTINLMLFIDNLSPESRIVGFASSRYLKGISTGLILLMCIFSGSNLKTAYSDLFTGAACRYDLELRQRYRLIGLCPSERCAVPPLADTPKTIFFWEDAIDAGKEGNDEVVLDYKTRYANFFGKEEIYLSR